MSYPRDLDEYTEAELSAEIERRLAHHRAGTCDYCGRSVENPPCRFPQRHRAITLKPPPPEADPPLMTEPLSAQVAAHMRNLTAELREAQQRVRDLEVGIRRMQDEAAAKGVELATPTPSASS